MFISFTLEIGLLFCQNISRNKRARSKRMSSICQMAKENASGSKNVALGGALFSFLIKVVAHVLQYLGCHPIESAFDSAHAVCSLGVDRFA